MCLDQSTSALWWHATDPSWEQHRRMTGFRAFCMTPARDARWMIAVNTAASRQALTMTAAARGPASVLVAGREGEDVMSRITDLAPNPDSSAQQSDTSVQREPAARSDAAPDDGQAYVRRLPKVGLWAWSFVGFVAATIIVVIALAAVSEIAIPMTFAVVLAVIFKPTVQFLKRHRFKPTLAAGLVVLGLLLVVAAVGVATLRGVTEQADQISAVTDKATSKAAD